MKRAVTGPRSGLGSGRLAMWAPWCCAAHTNQWTMRVQWAAPGGDEDFFLIGIFVVFLLFTTCTLPNFAFGCRSGASVKMSVTGNDLSWVR